ncbi:MAG: hypothetical protein KH020_16910 [Clostridiales bacterium]|nr:hypothetical protein [Clostridiales bacterium]
MEKIVLKDTTEINVEGGMSSNYFESIVTGYDEMKQLYEKLTQDNLSEFKVMNEAGLVCAILKHKKLSKECRFEMIEGTENLRVKVTLEDVDMKDVKLSQTLANTDYIVMMQGM